ncbi:MAG: ribosome small subunit-dependent GTPase A, partial [Acidobacteriota bacterium]|nr:ribosome small subunit-dependent GTPase A [Acidobacteriota bacterium]
FAQSFEVHASDEVEPGRVSRQLKGVYRVLTRGGGYDAVGKRSLGREANGFPVVGDWVACAPPGPGSEQGQIRAVLDRRTCFSRKAAGEATAEQVVAANVDTVFVVTGLDGDFNVRRLERFLVAVHESGADPVVVLNKADLVDDPASYAAEARACSPGMPVVVLSATLGIAIGELEAWLQPGRTVALVGSSGVGKSTLVNALVGHEAMETGAVRESDDRGQHTTSFRQLLTTPGGALVLDNPGIRELQAWSAEVGEAETFSDIEELSASCRFRNCSHCNEPGCGVLGALEDGSLGSDRWESYQKIRAEQKSLEEKKAERMQIQASYRKAVRQKRG